MPGLESDVLSLPPEPPQFAPRSFFHLWATWLASVLVAALVVYLFVLTSGDPLDHLHWPEDSLERLASRDMEVRAAVARTSPWERRLYGFMLGDDESTDDWIRWHEELAQESSSPDVELDRLILLGEAGRSTAVREGVDEWEPDDETAAKRKEWVTAAYLAPSLNRAAARTLIGEVRDELPVTWFADTLVARLASRSGDVLTHQQAEAAIATRGAVLLDRWRALEATGLLLAVAGLVSLGALLRSPEPRIAHAEMLTGLSLGDGYALFIRGALGFLVLGTGLGLLIPEDSALDSITGVATVAPILLYALWYVRHRGLSFAQAFGLTPGPGGWTRIALVALALIGLQLTGEALIGLVLDALHVTSHWADGLQENLVWGSWGLVTRETVDSVIWAPLGEEVAFRGVLYPALRSRFGVAPATAVSAAIFALAHGYGVLGFVAVFWSGVLWAVAYERTGSLWPGIIAHSAGNVMATVGVIALLRF